MPVNEHATLSTESATEYVSQLTFPGKPVSADPYAAVTAPYRQFAAGTSLPWQPANPKLSYVP